MSRVETENGPIRRESQPVMSMVRDLWQKKITEKVSFELEWKSERSGEEKDG